MQFYQKFYTALIGSIATLFGAGKCKFAPGTVGSLVAILPFFIWAPSLKNITIITICSFIIGLYASAQYSQILQQKDPSVIVIDELCGIWVAILICYLLEYIQFGVNNKVLIDYNNINVNTIGILSRKQVFLRNSMFLTLIFIFFRASDIIKPFPISLIDKNVAGGIGIMLDDVLAGVLTGLIVYLIWFIR
ncbi:MAG: phosphatidylglycerophosphatase A [Alphaproteobacteria bacterium]|nr:phosphatidylglycerophosphatase A [Rickettsiales bacterium]